MCYFIPQTPAPFKNLQKFCLWHNVLDFKVWRTSFEFLTFFSWSWQWCRKRRQITNLFWTTFLRINTQRDLNFAAFYYFIDNISCCSKFKCFQETISPPHFDPQERYIILLHCCLSSWKVKVRKLAVSMYLISDTPQHMGIMYMKLSFGWQESRERNCR